MRISELKATNSIDWKFLSSYHYPTTHSGCIGFEQCCAYEIAQGISTILNNILSSAKSGPGTAYYFHANV